MLLQRQTGNELGDIPANLPLFALDDLLKKNLFVGIEITWKPCDHFFNYISHSYSDEWIITEHSLKYVAERGGVAEHILNHFICSSN